MVNKIIKFIESEGGKWTVLFFLIVAASIVANLITGCATVEKYLPATAKEAKGSGEDIRKAVDSKGAKVIEATKRDAIRGIEKL